MRRRLDAQRGFALLIVLWSLVPLALLFTMLASAALSNTRSAGELRAAAAFEAAADGAIYTALFEQLQRGQAAATTSEMRPVGPGVTVEVQDLSGLVNPNTVPPALLQALLRRLGVPDADAGWIAGAIVDWRTPGRRRGQNGAKAPEYRQAGLDYGPPGAPFQSLDELGLVLNLRRPLLEALLPYLSLYAEGEPDPAAAAPVLRQALRDIGVVRPRGRTRTQVVAITATVGGPGNVQAIRRAVIRIAPSANGRPWRVLEWRKLFTKA